MIEQWQVLEILMTSILILWQLFMCRGYIIDYEDARMIKEKLCYVG